MTTLVVMFCIVFFILALKNGKLTITKDEFRKILKVYCVVAVISFLYFTMVGGLRLSSFSDFMFLGISLLGTLWKWCIFYLIFKCIYIFVLKPIKEKLLGK